MRTVTSGAIPLLLFCASVLVALLPASASAGGVTLDRNQGPAGTSVTAMGTDWPADAFISAFFSQNSVGTTKVKSDGTFELNFCVPKLAPGLYPTFFTMSGAGMYSGPPFTITEGTARCQINPARADLSPTAILYNSADLIAGKTVPFDSGVQNTGSQGTGVFNIRWFVDNVSVGYGSHLGVPANSTVLDGNSQYTWVATAGRHTITFAVDVDNYVSEANESNNSTSVTVTVAPATPLSAGWYKSNKPAVIYEDSELKVEWGRSYLFEYPKGYDPLYWYAEVVYVYKGSKSLKIDCIGYDKLPRVKEHIRDTSGHDLGYVAAEESLCDRNPKFAVTLKKGERFYNWAIFHNVPWARKGERGEVSIQWLPKYGSSPWVYPWASPIKDSPLVTCPNELVALEKCTPVSIYGAERPAADKKPMRRPQGSPQGSAPNLVVVVHGCCTESKDVRGEKDKNGVWHDGMWYTRGVEIARHVKGGVPSQYEFIVWDWTKDTPPLDPFKDFATQAPKAYKNAIDQGAALASAIEGKAASDPNRGVAVHPFNQPYRYIHLIAHSAGARLIDLTAKQLADDYKDRKNVRPFIHLTFLDAYTPLDGSKDKFGRLDGYPHYAEHYVDRGIVFPVTDFCLPNAFNFDITSWEPSERDWNGHQWPPIWYTQSVTNYFTYGHALSLEGGKHEYNDLARRFPVNKQCRLLDIGSYCPEDKASLPCWPFD